jgi:type IV pilus assembly protein PilQ
MWQKCMIVMFMVWGWTGIPVYAQSSGEATPEAMEGTALGEDATVPGVSMVEEGSEEGNVSLDFRDADIQNVLRILAYKSGVNIVTGPEVAGVVTIKLKDVPWQKALDVILETYGYGYERHGNIISVSTIETIKKRREDAQVLTEQEPLVTQTFVLNYARASDIIQSIEKMKTERGSVDYDERTNSLIVRDIQRNVDLISDVVEQLDQTTPQVLIEAKIVETTLSDTENMGIDWLTQATVKGAARPHTFPLLGQTENRFAKSFTNASGSIVNTDFPAPSAFTYGTLDFTQLQMVLQLLSTRTNTNILSNPRIVTLDNKPALINVGVEHPIPQFGVNEETGELQTTSLEYRNIGINFEVTPHVNNAGFVTLDLEPEVSEVAGSRSFQGIDVPLISTEKAVTSVMIKNGETLVIAGLIKDKVTDTKKKTPILGDIPLLSYLFTKNNKEITKTDLLIFLTPHIITPDIPEK